MLSRAQNTFHHNPRLRGPVSSNVKEDKGVFVTAYLDQSIVIRNNR